MSEYFLPTNYNGLIKHTGETSTQESIVEEAANVSAGEQIERMLMAGMNMQQIAMKGKYDKYCNEDGSIDVSDLVPPRNRRMDLDLAEITADANAFKRSEKAFLNEYKKKETERKKKEAETVKTPPSEPSTPGEPSSEA